MTYLIPSSENISPSLRPDNSLAIMFIALWAVSLMVFIWAAICSSAFTVVMATLPVSLSTSRSETIFMTFFPVSLPSGSISNSTTSFLPSLMASLRTYLGFSAISPESLARVTKEISSVPSLVISLASLAILCSSDLACSLISSKVDCFSVVVSSVGGLTGSSVRCPSLGLSLNFFATPSIAENPPPIPMPTIRASIAPSLIFLVGSSPVYLATAFCPNVVSNSETPSPTGLNHTPNFLNVLPIRFFVASEFIAAFSPSGPLAFSIALNWSPICLVKRASKSHSKTP